jgi:hypothetical protein
MSFLKSAHRDEPRSSTIGRPAGATRSHAWAWGLRTWPVYNSMISQDYILLFLKPPRTWLPPPLRAPGARDGAKTDHSDSPATLPL